MDAEVERLQQLVAQDIALRTGMGPLRHLVVGAPPSSQQQGHAGLGTASRGVWECGMLLAALMQQATEPQGHLPPAAVGPLAATLPARRHAGRCWNCDGPWQAPERTVARVRDHLQVVRQRGGPAPGALELGSGSGIAGIAAAVRGCRVLLTDLPEVVTHGVLPQNMARFNALLRQPAEADSEDAARGPPLTLAALDWYAPLPEVLGLDDLDLVLGADLAFHERLEVPLGETLARLAQRNQGALVVLVHKQRRRETARFAAALASVLADPQLEVWPSDPRFAFLTGHLTKPCPA
jgi:predicted nicotinamide N-methyase